MELSPKHYTVDRVEIVDGLRAWDYDAQLVVVCFEHTFGRSDMAVFDGWFTVHLASNFNHVRQGKIMNGERLTTVHPFTREKA